MHNRSQLFPQTSAHFGHDGTRKEAKSILHNWWRTRALEFHQETMEESKQQQDWFCIKLYIIFASFCLYGSKNVISTKHYFQCEEITTNFSNKI